MKLFLLILVAIVSLAQSPEEQIPPGHYCQNHPPTRKQPEAHECHCDYRCDVQYDGEGKPYYEAREMQDCKAYCHKDGRRCTCHPEEPCPKPA